MTEGLPDPSATGLDAPASPPVTPPGMKQVGWWIADDDLLIDMDEEGNFGHCYRELRPVFVRAVQ